MAFTGRPSVMQRNYGFDHPITRSARIAKRQRYVKRFLELGLPEWEAKTFAADLIPCWEERTKMAKPQYRRPRDIRSTTDKGAVDTWPMPSEVDRDPNDFDDGYSNMLPKSIPIKTAVGFESYADQPYGKEPPYPEFAAGPGSYKGFGEVDNGPSRSNQARKFFRGTPR